MNYLIDIVGSSVIGAIVFLVLMNLNMNMNTSSGENLFLNVAQREATTTSDVIENDFYKIGYRISGEKIAIADSTEIKFYADINNDGNDDSVHYYLGDISELSSTTNPNDRVLYRVENDSLKTEFFIVGFSLSYCDSSGEEFNYSTLKSSAKREKIRSIDIVAKIESSEPIDGSYQSAGWYKKIAPKNLR